ncbi:MAG TPA: hypothetical protein VG929_06430 [Actinomycetota bacterium]|nr:hypothetical protein [Actinomycetota bacterium]
MTKQLVNLVVIAVGVFNVAVGVWAFIAPRSFFDTVAPFPPFNEHLFHDLGAFQGALGVTLLIALWVRDGLMIAMLGNMVGAIVHFVSHLIDSDLGGRPTDPVATGFVAAALVFALLVYRRRAESRDAPETHS